MLPKCPERFIQNSAKTLKSIAFLSLGILILSIIAQAQTPTTVNDGHGKEWRLPQSTFLSWNQVATICPQDGVSRCNGAVGTQNLDTWTWATDEQVLQLMSYYEPAMLTNRSVFGFQYSTGATNFLNAFQAPIITVICTGYICTGDSTRSLTGWTASKDSYGLPYIAASSLTSFGGSFSVAPNAGAAQSSGVWLWRDPNGIYANDDSGMVASPAGGTALSNVLANDTIAGAAATLSNVFITQISSTNPGISVNQGNGSVNVANPTPAGTYTLVYRICSNTNVTFCDDATVTVLVKPYTIDAVNDYGTISPSVGGNAVNVLSNDTFSGGGAAGNVSLSLVSMSPSNSGITLDSNGSVNVARGSALGTFNLTYQICANVQPTLCDTAVAAIVVKHYVIDAVNDYVRASSKINSSPINLLTNDTFNGGPATPAQVQITQLSGPTSGVTLNTATGLVSIVAKTTSGLYYINYKICEINAPTNCDSAIATIELSGK
jgi:hypothetical protein